jgi:hypothetical protein
MIGRPPLATVLKAQLAANAEIAHAAARPVSQGAAQFLGLGRPDPRHPTRRASDRTSHGRPIYPELTRDTTRCVRDDCTRRTQRRKVRPPVPGATKVAVWCCPVHGPLWPAPEAERIIAGVLDAAE